MINTCTIRYFTHVPLKAAENGRRMDPRISLMFGSHLPTYNPLIDTMNAGQ